MHPQFQPALFEVESVPARAIEKLSLEAEEFLTHFFRWRATCASVNTARADVSQLRSLSRLTGEWSPRLLLDTPESVARVIRGQADEATIRTNQRRFTSIVQLASFLVEALGDSSAKEKLGILTKVLEGSDSADWYRTGITVGGRGSCPSRHAPTLTPRHLPLIAASGPTGKTLVAVRARTIVHLACYSGLRVSEIARLEWRSVTPSNQGVRFTVVRCGREVSVIGSEGAASALEALSSLEKRRLGVHFAPGGVGYAFSARETGRPLSPEQVHNIIVAAVGAAGFPTARRRDLLAAFTTLLAERGLPDHAVCLALGLQRVSTVDRLRDPYRRLSAQRQLRERLEPLV